MAEKIIWTDLATQEIAKKLEQDHQFKVGKSVVNKLLKKHNYRHRKSQKKKTMKSVAYRNQQFVKIKTLLSGVRTSGNPIISFDTKKKENLGNFYRADHLYTKEALQVYDHDLNGFAEGVIIPHGIYDLQHNTGFIHIGISRTPVSLPMIAFDHGGFNMVAYSIRMRLTILALCDGGGSNGSRHYIFKEDLQ